MILGLSGFAQSGKSSCGQYLAENYGFYQVSFADKLKVYCLKVNPWIFTDNNYSSDSFVRLEQLVSAFGWEQAKTEYPGVREFLQATGHNARETFGQRFWIDQALTSDVLKHEDIVITDVRYMNEVEAVVDLDGFIVRILREGVGPANDHITEQILPHDYLLHNTPIGTNGMRILRSNIDSMMNNLATLKG